MPFFIPVILGVIALGGAGVACSGAVAGSGGDDAGGGDGDGGPKPDGSTTSPSPSPFPTTSPVATEPATPTPPPVVEVPGVRQDWWPNFDAFQCVDFDIFDDPAAANRKLYILCHGNPNRLSPCRLAEDDEKPAFCEPAINLYSPFEFVPVSHTDLGGGYSAIFGTNSLENYPVFLILNRATRQVTTAQEIRPVVITTGGGNLGLFAIGAPDAVVLGGSLLISLRQQEMGDDAETVLLGGGVIARYLWNGDGTLSYPQTELSQLFGFDPLVVPEDKNPANFIKMSQDSAWVVFNGSQGEMGEAASSLKMLRLNNNGEPEFAADQDIAIHPSGLVSMKNVVVTEDNRLALFPRRYPAGYDLFGVTPEPNGSMVKYNWRTSDSLMTARWFSPTVLFAGDSRNQVHGMRLDPAASEPRQADLLRSVAIGGQPIQSAVDFAGCYYYVGFSKGDGVSGVATFRCDVLTQE